MQRTALVLTAIIVLASPAMAQEETAPAITGADDLVKQKSRLWDEVWVRPGTDISAYDKLYIWQSVFQFRDVSDDNQNRTTTAMLRSNQDHFTISEEGRSTFEKIVSEVVAKELSRSKQFEIVDEIGPRTLLVRGMILDIVSNVPPNVGRQANVHLSSMGEATFIFELIDAETGVIQARAGDRRYIQPPSRMNEMNPAPTTSATVWNDVELWARDQAQTLRKELDKTAKKAKKTKN
ncbi:MAG: DUF3313 family protein [Thermoanaerobaculales bacterium]|jgi:hypothetical protein|nr:DUF3313 family protein [Thermoanaerobaculales bacterium]